MVYEIFVVMVCGTLLTGVVYNYMNHYESEAEAETDMENDWVIMREWSDEES